MSDLPFASPTSAHAGRAASWWLIGGWRALISLRSSPSEFPDSRGTPSAAAGPSAPADPNPQEAIPSRPLDHAGRCRAPRGGRGRSGVRLLGGDPQRRSVGTRGDRLAAARRLDRERAGVWSRRAEDPAHGQGRPPHTAAPALTGRARCRQRRRPASSLVELGAREGAARDVDRAGARGARRSAVADGATRREGAGAVRHRGQRGLPRCEARKRERDVRRSADEDACGVGAVCAH